MSGVTIVLKATAWQPRVVRIRCTAGSDHCRILSLVHIHSGRAGSPLALCGNLQPLGPLSEGDCGVVFQNPPLQATDSGQRCRRVPTMSRQSRIVLISCSQSGSR